MWLILYLSARPPTYGTAKLLYAIVFNGTDLRKGLSEAKFDAEADFEVRLAVARQKPRQIDENQIFRTEIFVEQKFSASKNKTSGIFRNAFWQSFAPIGALFKT